MIKESGFKWKLGMFITVGLVLFVAAIYFVGSQQNLFGSTFHLKSKFKTVSGLQVGNNVRFSGINIGTVKEIDIVTDSSVVVNLIIKEEARQFIKTDALASIGSDGLMGDKVLTISPGTYSMSKVKDNDQIKSKEAIEMDDLMGGVKKTLDNAGVITAQLAEFTYNMNNGNGTLSKLMTDEAFAASLKNTLSNLETSTNQFAKFTVSMNNGKGVLSKLVNDEKMGTKIDSTIIGINETIKAAQNNFLLKGYFNKKKKEDAKKLENAKDQQELKKETDLKKVEETKK